jgi:hypothetical protein
MKRAKSDLIDAFLVNVRKGLVSGREGSSGPVILQRMAEALEAIRDGANPNKALQVKRSAGGPAEPDNLPLAFRIHQLRQARENWAVVEIVANEWLAERGRDAVTQTRMKQIYKQHRATVEMHESLARMMELTNQQGK